MSQPPGVDLIPTREARVRPLPDCAGAPAGATLRPMNGSGDRTRGTDTPCTAASSSTWWSEPPMTTSLRKLVQRIREEFEDLPNLHLTAIEAARFWGLDLVTCQQVLAELLASGSVTLDGDQRYSLVQC